MLNKNSALFPPPLFEICRPGIMRQVEAQTGGRVRLGPGTLYSSIQALLEEKLIEEVGHRADTKLGEERRRYYR